MSDSSDKRYNGWANYETWAVALWIGNEQGSHEYWEKEQAEECYARAVDDAPGGNREDWTETAARDLADRMKDEFTSDEANPLADKPSVYSDLLSAALSEVDWYEIATNYVTDLDRDEIEKEHRQADDEE